MKTILHAVLTSLTLLAVATPSANAEDTAGKTAAPLYGFKLADIDGGDTSLDAHRGKVLLLVNVASQCGATSQYASLVALQEKYGAKGLVVIGIPANNFGGQEPGTNAEIKSFCSGEYGVSFPMMAKVSVEGDDQDPLFKYLTSAKNKDFTGPIRWNFEKFLVSRDGLLLRRFRTGTEPEDTEVVNSIEEALEEKPGAGGGCEDC